MGRYVPSLSLLRAVSNLRGSCNVFWSKADFIRLDCQTFLVQFESWEGLHAIRIVVVIGILNELVDKSSILGVELSCQSMSDVSLWPLWLTY